MEPTPHECVCLGVPTSATSQAGLEHHILGSEESDPQTSARPVQSAVVRRPDPNPVQEELTQQRSAAAAACERSAGEAAESAALRAQLLTLCAAAAAAPVEGVVAAYAEVPAPSGDGANGAPEEAAPDAASAQVLRLVEKPDHCSLALPYFPVWSQDSTTTTIP